MPKPKQTAPLSITISQAYLTRELESSRKLVGLMDEHVEAGKYNATDLVKIASGQLRKNILLLIRLHDELDDARAIINRMAREPEDEEDEVD